MPTQDQLLESAANYVATLFAEMTDEEYFELDELAAFTDARHAIEEILGERNDPVTKVQIFLRALDKYARGV